MEGGLMEMDELKESGEIMMKLLGLKGKFEDWLTIEQLTHVFEVLMQNDRVPPDLLPGLIVGQFLELAMAHPEWTQAVAQRFRNTCTRHDSAEDVHRLIMELVPVNEEVEA
jgi:hypothetical protein